jgi:hypothetical protein
LNYPKVLALQQYAQLEKEVVWELCQNLENTVCFVRLKSLAHERGYLFAAEEERFVVDAGKWWRGGGFNNHSQRHRRQTEAWARCCEAVETGDLDVGVLVMCGLSLSLSGLMQDFITATIVRLREQLAKQKRVLPALFSEEEIAEICFSMIKPFHSNVYQAQTLVKGESSSLKRAEKDAEVAAG